MSAEVREFVHLRCDGVSFGGHRCGNTFGQFSHLPATSESLEACARRARDAGWAVDVRSEGLKGWSASSFCRDHRPAVNP